MVAYGAVVGVAEGGQVDGGGKVGVGRQGAHPHPARRGGTVGQQAARAWPVQIAQHSRQMSLCALDAGFPLTADHVASD